MFHPRLQIESIVHDDPAWTLDAGCLIDQRASDIEWFEIDLEVRLQRQANRADPRYRSRDNKMQKWIADFAGDSVAFLEIQREKIAGGLVDGLGQHAKGRKSLGVGDCRAKRIQRRVKKDGIKRVHNDLRRK